MIPHVIASFHANQMEDLERVLTIAEIPFHSVWEPNDCVIIVDIQHKDIAEDLCRDVEWWQIEQAGGNIKKYISLNDKEKMKRL